MSNTNDTNELTPWRQAQLDREAKAHAEGRTYFTGRCNAYDAPNGSPNSGRCYNGQGTGLYTLPERKGVCDECWRRRHGTD